jgi:hypothetical protein
MLCCCAAVFLFVSCAVYLIYITFLYIIFAAREEADALRQYDYMWREKIGQKYAQFYILWAGLEMRRGNSAIAKEIINNVSSYMSTV